MPLYRPRTTPTERARAERDLPASGDGTNAKFPQVGFYIVADLDAAQADFLVLE
jgi:hypothetical protein